MLLGSSQNGLLQALMQQSFYCALQPALLWLVPCMLTTVAFSAWRRGELGLLWHGWEGLDGAQEGEDAERLLSDASDAAARV